jgi:hypothetical protein
MSHCLGFSFSFPVSCFLFFVFCLFAQLWSRAQSCRASRDDLDGADGIERAAISNNRNIRSDSPPRPLLVWLLIAADVAAPTRGALPNPASAGRPAFADCRVPVCPNRSAWSRPN